MFVTTGKPNQLLSLFSKNNMLHYALHTFQRIHPDDTIVKEYQNFRITRNEYEFNFSNYKPTKVFFIEERVVWRPFYFLFLVKRQQWKKVLVELDDIIIKWWADVGGYWLVSDPFTQPAQFENIVEAQQFIMTII